MSTLRFTLFSIAGAIVLGGLVYFLSPSVIAVEALPFALGGVFLAAFSTIASYAIVSRGLKTRVQAFMQFIMGGMMVKMFLGIAVILFVAWKFEEIVTQYVLTYFFCYFIFLAFEVVTLMTNFRAEKSDRKAEKEDYDV